MRRSGPFQLIALFCLLLAVPVKPLSAAPNQPVRLGFVGIPRFYQATEGEWGNLIRASREARLGFLSVGYGAWKEIEATPGVFVWKDLQPLLRVMPGSGLRLVLDLPTPISLSGEADDLPAGLTFTSFSDPVLIARYKALVRAAIIQFGAHLDAITFHTENSELFVANHPAERQAFCDFLAKAAAYGRRLAPSIKFANYNTPRHPDGLVRCMMRGMDLAGIAAIAEFPGGRPADFGRRLAHMSELAGGRKLAIVEMGWPSSRALGSSELLQKQVVTGMLELLNRRARQIEFASYYTVFDEDRAIARQWIALAFPPPQWTAEQRRLVLEWVTSLGLKTITMRAKPAWTALVNRPR